MPEVGQLLAGGPLPATDVYTITATVDPGAPITGFFLNVINDLTNGLPTGGPGRQPSNGNFVVSELTIAAARIPEPLSLVVLGATLTGLGVVHNRRSRPSD